ncbi:MAG: HAMP domain-containing protein, partial [Myxococcota bacterium]
MRTLILRSAVSALLTVMILWEAQVLFYPSDEGYWRAEAEGLCALWAQAAPRLDLASFPAASPDDADAWGLSCSESLRLRSGVDDFEVIARGEAGREVVLGAATAEYDDESGERLYWWLCLAVAGVVSVLVARPVWRSSASLGRVAGRLAAGDLDARAEPSGPQELQNLARALNGMAERIGTQTRVRQVLLRAVAHELGQPLTQARFALELLQSAEDGEARSVQVTRLERSVERLEALSEGVARQLQRARAQASATPSVPLAPLVREVARSYPRVALELAEVDGAIDPELFRIAVRNLLENAVRHAASDVRVHLDEAGLRVEDDGLGLPEGSA